VTIRVLLVDDQQLVRTGFRMILEDEPDIEVVGEAADGRLAVELARHVRPDVVVMDIRMPVSGLAIAQQILAEEPAQTIVLFTAYIEDGVIDLAERAGVCEVLEKDQLHDLPTVLEACVRGRRELSA